MGIQSIEVHSVVLRYHEPFRIAPSTALESNNIVVKIQTDFDIVGIGECSPSLRVTQETPQTVLTTLDKIAPRLIGMCPLRIEQDIEVMDELVKGNPSAKAGVDIALHDIFGKTAGKPLFRVMGGYRDEVLTDLTLSIKKPKEMAEDAVKAVERGFKALKVKVGVDPKEDVERIKQIRKAIGSDTAIRIDANQGWTVKQAIETLNKLQPFEIEFVEQPVQAEDAKGLAKVKQHSPIPVMADESVHTAGDLLRLIKEDAVDLINIKLMKTGGIWNARKLVAIAEAAHIPCMIGCMGESTIGITAGVHLGAALKNIRYADLDSDILIRDKLVTEGGAILEKSERIPTEASGLGIAKLNGKLLGKPVKTYK